MFLNIGLQTIVDPIYFHCIHKKGISKYVLLCSIEAQTIYIYWYALLLLLIPVKSSQKISMFSLVTQMHCSFQL